MSAVPTSTPDQEGLRVQDLARRFGGRWAVARVDLAVPRGGACMVTGANGSGKTTLLRCCATALKPHHGQITFGGVDLWRRRALVRPTIALLSHATRLYEDLSAQENLATWARLGGVSADLSDLLARVGLPVGRQDPVRTFSAGMRRRLALARVLLKEPELLLLDEPFTALDPEGRALVLQAVGALRQRGTTVLVATHVPGEAAALCEQRVHMEAGRVVRISEGSA
ncbi:MAG: heme ABC exporter ATP-binding protein CcmA [Deltaproteobacteria bacterium]|nr:MAG: heme ABC exporter ATP-binding protein CcmA [Deltaproteobacteria bacterium]